MKSTHAIRLFASVAAFTLTAQAQAFAAGEAAAEQGAADQAADAPAEKEIVVTGVFSAKAIENAPISISAITAQELKQQVANSAADLIKNVPGVFVNSSLGEIRNVVFSRGVSANSLDGDGGYYYVSMQEDGLPVEPVTVGNFGPDYFARPDVMLDRLEGLRGGTATVTGNNAPGGIFNYISRTGKSHPGFEVSTKLGLEGNGKNPYYRADAYAGGALGNDVYYAIGGFYRESEGARYPGYKLNKGGQIRANLLWDYGAGSLRIDAKYLNDHNGWFEFVPATNFGSPTISAPFNTYSSVLPPANPHSFTNPDGTSGSWDGSDLVHSRTLSFGATWNHDLGGGVKVQNRARYTENKADWSTGGLIFPLSLDDFFLSLLNGTIGLPGTTTYKVRGTGAIAAQVQSFSGFDHTVTVNNLPNQSILQNGVLSELALSQKFRSRTVQDQFTLSAALGNHSLAAGAYFAWSNMKQRGGAAGLGISGLTPSSQLYDITQTLPDGTVLQITDPAGFASQGGGILDGDGYGGKQHQIAFFAGDEWQINDQLSVDGGVRYENIKYDIYNFTLNGAVPVNGGAGADGNPLTAWDNMRQSYGANTYTKRKFSYWNFTGSVNYKVSDQFQAYARYTRGKKAPDMRTIVDIDTPAEIATLYPDPQVITQVEVGLKYRGDHARVALFPFYSKLSNVGSPQTFTNTDGTLYVRTTFGQIETYGLEIDADADLGAMFNIRTAITVQSPKASKFGIWLANAAGPADDVLVASAKGDADNNPKLLTRTTATFKPLAGLEVFLTHSYTGKRAANRANAWYLPGFHQFDMGSSYTFGPDKRFTIQANINNLFNQFGVMSWARSGGFLASLDRQGLTKADVAANPNQLFNIVPVQPRSFWLTGTVKF